MSSHSTVEPGVPPSETLSARLVMTAQVSKYQFQDTIQRVDDVLAFTASLNSMCVQEPLHVYHAVVAKDNTPGC